MEPSMDPVNLAFLLMLVAFLLLTLTAAARDLRRRWSPVGPSHDGPQLKSSVPDLLLLLAVATAWYNVSSGWIAQLINYPLYADMSTYGPQAFLAFRRRYDSGLPIIMLPAALMCLAWGVLLWLPCRNVPKRIVWTIVVFCVAFVAATIIPASTQVQMVREGFSNALETRLLWSNGIRAIILTIIGVLALSAVRRRWMNSDSTGT
jgi:hypothetical protein